MKVSYVSRRFVLISVSTLSTICHLSKSVVSKLSLRKQGAKMVQIYTMKKIIRFTARNLMHALSHGC